MVGRLRDGTSDLQGSQAVQVRFLGLVAFLLYFYLWTLVFNVVHYRVASLN
jgi:hypothetical protein